jgi:hypothetical protein
LLSLITTKRYRNFVGVNAASIASSFVPVVDVNKLIPAHASDDERDFVVANERLLKTSASDFANKSIQTTRLMYRKLPLYLKILFGMCLIFGIVIILPIMVYVGLLAIRDIYDALNVIFLVTFAGCVCIVMRMLMKYSDD